MEEIALELNRYSIKVAAIQETRWSGMGTVNKNYYTMLYSGRQKTRTVWSSIYSTKRVQRQNTRIQTK